MPPMSDIDRLGISLDPRAAHLHPDVEGEYPSFNLSSRLTLPNDRRLETLNEAFTQGQRDHLDRDIEFTYKVIEQ